MILAPGRSEALTRKGRRPPSRLRFLWAATLLLPWLLCASFVALIAVTQVRATDPNVPSGSIAGACVEWGTNYAGRIQVGVWWEATELTFAKPTVPPVGSLTIQCGYLPWLPFLPLRGAYIYTHTR